VVGGMSLGSADSGPCRRVARCGGEANPTGSRQARLHLGWGRAWPDLAQKAPPLPYLPTMGSAMVRPWLRRGPRTPNERGLGPPRDQRLLLRVPPGPVGRVPSAPMPTPMPWQLGGLGCVIFF